MLRYREWTFASPDTDIRHKVTDIRLYADDKEKICLEWKPVRVPLPENEGLAWEDWNRYDSICIYQTDYDRFLLPTLRALFPVTDPDPNGWGVQTFFDLTSMNFFGKADWQRMLGALKECAEAAAGEEKEFYAAVLQYAARFMAVSDWFCIEGNL